MSEIAKDSISIYNETSDLIQQLQKETEIDSQQKFFESSECNIFQTNIQENLDDDFVKEALRKGLDLRKYSKEVNQDLSELEKKSIKDYYKEAGSIIKLHSQVKSCDEILETIESMLDGFQKNLSSISSEIQILQQQSVTMNIKLKNRQSIRSELSQFIDEMLVPESMIKTILEGQLTERAFLECLHELHHKIEFLYEKPPHEIKCFSDIHEILYKLKTKAITRIREFILQKTYQFRKPMQNYQITQDTLLKNRFFYEFLTLHDRSVARECRDEYVNTMSKVYFSYFKEYSSKLNKLQLEEVAEKDDLLGADDKPKTSIFSSKPTMRNRSTVFTLGNRFSTIENEIESTIIIPHASQKSDQKYLMENIFRSEQFALLDNSCNEYMFLSDFFMVKDKPCIDLFQTVFGKTYGLLIKSSETLIQSTHDAIAIFLCINIIQRYEILAKQRQCFPILMYYESILEILWQKFDSIMQMHSNSVALVDTHKFSSLDVRPHYISRRYAEFLTSLLTINESIQNPKLNANLSQLQVEIQNFILRLASEFGQRKDQLISLINNYDLLLNVITERIKEDNREAQTLRDLLNNRINDYVEEVLMPYFGNLICFVKECEILIEKENINSLKSYENHVNPLIKNFTNDWKKSLELINQEIMRSFTNFKNGQAILQATLTQLIQYYHRFHKILSHNCFKYVSGRNEMLSIHHLMAEIKKHKPTF
ncbi:unnamed protein product [Brachionus calyciflorus]|uniref:Vacuolar protein sorting-associated protein 52 homolog n=1 Tax=Brachionus calyciflorus TaxID=104777 RepID=A0A813NFD4_9BILA|nr:unnamed protein product [Brachionus calyciflorus]